MTGARLLVLEGGLLTHLQQCLDISDALPVPDLFENRLCFRMAGLDWTKPTLHLTFDQICFFDAVDANEAFGCRLARSGAAAGLEPPQDAARIDERLVCLSRCFDQKVAVP